MHLTGLERLKNVTARHLSSGCFGCRVWMPGKRPHWNSQFLVLGQTLAPAKRRVARLFGKLLIELGVRKSDGAFNAT